MAALAAYFDDSKNSDEGIFAVAGYLSFVEQMGRSVYPRMGASDPVGSASDQRVQGIGLSPMCGEFEPPWTRAECNALTEQLVSVIIGPALRNVVGIGVAVVIDRFSELQVEARQKWERFAYLLCCGVVADAVYQLSEDYIKDDTVQIVFDEQDELEAKVGEVFKELRSMWPEEYTKKLRNPCFCPAIPWNPFRRRIY